MKLKDFFDSIKEDISLSRWCRKHRIPEKTIYNIYNGQDIMLTTAMQIEKATKRKVKCQDLVNPEKLQKLLKKEVRKKRA